MRNVTSANKLFYLYLLPRGRVKLLETVLAKRLGLHVWTVRAAKRALKEQGLLIDHKPHVGAASVLEALECETFKDWPCRKRELPKAVLETPVASRLVWLYLSGVNDAQTLSDLAEGLDVSYATVRRGIEPLKPYLDIVGANPMHLKLAA
ncbi:hypothetical protein BH24DEI2_BH24DEI2_07580 [soil metagenome]